MKTIKFLTLGCKVNQYETQNIREQFLYLGLIEVKGDTPADIYLINTCTVTHRSDSDSSYLIRRSVRENPKAKIVLTGCFSQLDQKNIKKKYRISLFIKNEDKENAASIFAQKFLGKKEIICNSGISHFEGRTRAFIKIQDGCNNCCSYCRVPIARGKSKSRKLAFIIKEAQRLVANGFKEIVLCGVCLGAYGRDFSPELGLVDVINELEKIDGLLRIRLSSIEAMDVTSGLINKIKTSRKLCHHLHIPIQSGDDTILKKMNRRYKSLDYLNLIKIIKKNVPDIAITTDVMVGFPEETEENFNNTVKLVKQITPLKVHIFPFSLRPGTLICKKKPKVVNPHIIQTRLKQLKNVAEKLAEKFRNRYKNKSMDVLIEEVAFNGYFEGYTTNYLRVKFKSDKKLHNQIIKIKLNNYVINQS